MNHGQRKVVMTLALAGITAGIAGCGGAAPPEAASPATEPAGEKAGCKGEVGEKHACGGDMKKDDMKEGDAMPAGSGAPPDKPAP
jgi:hypothetical protein